MVGFHHECKRREYHSLYSGSIFLPALKVPKNYSFLFLKLINKISILPFILFKKLMSFVSTNKCNFEKLYKTINECNSNDAILMIAIPDSP